MLLSHSASREREREKKKKFCFLHSATKQGVGHFLTAWLFVHSTRWDVVWQREAPSGRPPSHFEIISSGRRVWRPSRFGVQSCRMIARWKLASGETVKCVRACVRIGLYLCDVNLYSVDYRHSSIFSCSRRSFPFCRVSIGLRRRKEKCSQSATPWSTLDVKPNSSWDEYHILLPPPPRWKGMRLFAFVELQFIFFQLDPDSKRWGFSLRRGSVEPDPGSSLKL